MDNDRTRPFLEEPVYSGVPVSWATNFLQSKIKKYRESNPLFYEYLINIYKEIKGRDLSYCDNIPLFLEGDLKKCEKEASKYIKEHKLQKLIKTATLRFL